jgi:opacity protein-like surface antigen
MRTVRSAIGAALLVSAAPGSAIVQDYARPGAYVALNGVASLPLSGLSRDDTGIGAAGRFGYRVSDRFALEAQAEYSGDNGFGGAHQTLVTANARAYFSDRRVQPYALLGLGAAFPSSRLRKDDASFAFRAGAGVDAYLSERVGLLLEATYSRPTDSGAALDAVNIGWGLFYRW